MPSFLRPLIRTGDSHDALLATGEAVAATVCAIDYLAKRLRYSAFHDDAIVARRPKRAHHLAERKLDFVPILVYQPDKLVGQILAPGTCLRTKK